MIVAYLAFSMLVFSLFAATWSTRTLKDTLLKIVMIFMTLWGMSSFITYLFYLSKLH